MIVEYFGGEHMQLYKELYFFLFAAIADAVDCLEKGDVWSAKERLIQAEQEAEERYICYNDRQ